MSWPTWPTSPPSHQKLWSSLRLLLWWASLLCHEVMWQNSCLHTWCYTCFAEFWWVPPWCDVLVDPCLCWTVLLWSCQWIPLHLSKVCENYYWILVAFYPFNTRPVLTFGWEIKPSFAMVKLESWCFENRIHNCKESVLQNIVSGGQKGVIPKSEAVIGWTFYLGQRFHHKTAMNALSFF